MMMSLCVYTCMFEIVYLTSVQVYCFVSFGIYFLLCFVITITLSVSFFVHFHSQIFVKEINVYNSSNCLKEIFLK